MLDIFGQLQTLVYWGLFVIAVGLKGFALFDALRQRAEAFPVAGKQTKQIWLAITGVSAAVQVVIPDPLSLLNLIGAAGAIIYLVDVRPAVRQIGGSRGTHQGPYGPW